MFTFWKLKATLKIKSVQVTWLETKSHTLYSHDTKVLKHVFHYNVHFNIKKLQEVIKIKFDTKISNKHTLDQVLKLPGVHSSPPSITHTLNQALHLHLLLVHSQGNLTVHHT
jgi:hypothetical protein